MSKFNNGAEIVCTKDYEMGGIERKKGTKAIVKYEYYGDGLFYEFGDINKDDRVMLWLEGDNWKETEYQLEINGQEYTVPKKNLLLLAITKAMDFHLSKKLKTEEDAIKLFEDNGIKVKEVEYVNE